MSAGKDRSPCARCAETLGRSCCQPGPKERLATLTRADVDRIQAATGWRREHFVEHEPLSSAEVLAYEARRPGYRGYFRSTPVRWGLRAHRGACVFLGPEGCTLDAAARPTACRLYPFEPTEHGWTLAVERSASVELAARSGEPRCLAAEEARSRGGLLHVFHLDVEDLTALIDRLRAEVQAHPEPPDRSQVTRRPRRRRAGGPRAADSPAGVEAAVECPSRSRE
ncbi:MAG TPA: YkgJ family cysteine cluster protein [Myxococcaceae bacterium]|nr:YkgJ family cysteine cluster protein [Myxococcaceae bacterium]